MNRAVMIAGVVATLGLSGVVGAGAASAQPFPACDYTLSPPQVVQLDGKAVVTATVAPAACAAPFRPSVSVACVQLVAPNSANQCQQARGADVAQVYYGEYKPGANYVSTGRGCGTVYSDMVSPKCLILGPFNAVL